MKIVLISSGVLPVPPVGYGGLEQVVADLAIELDKMGHQVVVICPSESTIDKVGNIKKFDCGPCNPNAHAWETQAVDKYAPWLVSEECKDAIIHDHTWGKHIYRLKAGHPELNIMSTLHGMLCYHTPPPVNKPSMAGISKSHAGWMSAGLGIPVRYVYNGIDVDKYIPNRGKRNGRYLFLARITKFKGSHVFADAMKQLGLKGDLVGDDTMVEDKEYVERVMAQCVDYPEVRYWGGVSRERAVEFFRASKCYVLPCTKGWEEPFGLTVIESMACGCPVVATASGAIPELIEHGKTGYVVNEIADLINFLNEDSIKVLKADDCRKRAEMFSRKNMADNYLKLYNELIEAGGW